MAKHVSALGVLAHLPGRPMSYDEAGALFECTPRHVEYLVTRLNLPKIKRRIGKHPRLHTRLPAETIAALKAVLWRTS